MKFRESITRISQIAPKLKLPPNIIIFCNVLVTFSFCNVLVTFSFCNVLVTFSFCNVLVTFSFCNVLVTFRGVTSKIQAGAVALS